jgi:hypothetical protein
MYVMHQETGVVAATANGDHLRIRFQPNEQGLMIQELMIGGREAFPEQVERGRIQSNGGIRLPLQILSVSKFLLMHHARC